MPAFHPTRSDRPRRPGQVAPLLVVLLLVLLAAFAVAVNMARLWTVRVELQIATDSAGHAAAGILLDDDLLRNDIFLLYPLLDRARDEANLFAAIHPVSGRTLVLDPNPANMPDGDIVFGAIDNPLSKVFTPVIGVSDPATTPVPLINAVRVRGVLSRERDNAPGLILGPFVGKASAGVQTATTVMLDRDVIGFAPPGVQAIPLAPVALLADYPATDSRAWQTQVEKKQGPDQYTYDRQTQTIKPGADGLFEFKAVRALDNSQLKDANVNLLFIGTTDLDGLANQLLNGVTPAQLTDFGGRFVLGTDNRLAVTSTEVGPVNPSSDLTKLHAALDQLRQTAAARIWPLYCGFDAGTGKARVCGFVAARVAAVDPIVGGQPLTFRLQPTLISTGTAVTDFTRRGVNGTPINNPYLCKLRFVE